VRLLENSPGETRTNTKSTSPLNERLPKSIFLIKVAVTGNSGITSTRDVVLCNVEMTCSKIMLVNIRPPASVLKGRRHEMGWDVFQQLTLTYPKRDTAADEPDMLRGGFKG
jgi:hypothetical protein